jgi:hypothetical protein
MMQIMREPDGANYLSESLRPVSDELTGLKSGMERLFSDGFSALGSNSDLDDAVRAAAWESLTVEKTVCDRIEGPFPVVNGDAWSNRIDGEDGTPFAKSVDLLLPVTEDGLPVLLLVEGKLGLAPREQRSRLRNPSYAEIAEKYRETKAKVCRVAAVSVSRTMSLIVPFAVCEVARNTFARRNVSNGECRIIPADASSFLAGINVID